VLQDQLQAILSQPWWALVLLVALLAGVLALLELVQERLKKGSKE